VTTTRSFDAANRLTSVTNGTMTTSGTWNAAGLLASLTVAVDTTSFACDPSGARVAATDTAGTITSMWASATSTTTSGLIAHGETSHVSLDGSSAVEADMPNGSGGTGRQWVVTYQQGTLVAATDKAGGCLVVWCATAGVQGGNFYCQKGGYGFGGKGGCLGGGVSGAFVPIGYEDRSCRTVIVSAGPGSLELGQDGKFPFDAGVGGLSLDGWAAEMHSTDGRYRDDGRSR